LFHGKEKKKKIRKKQKKQEKKGFTGLWGSPGIPGVCDSGCLSIPVPNPGTMPYEGMLTSKVPLHHRSIFFIQPCWLDCAVTDRLAPTCLPEFYSPGRVWWGIGKA
jgi:hypothetical protein